MKVLYTEQSQTSNSGKVTIGIFIVALLVWMGYTLHRSFEAQALYLADLLVQIIALLVILKQARSHYTYILTDKEFIIEEKVFFSNKRMALPYEMIDGVYAYRREFFGQLKFRYKYRKVNSMDPRPVWALAYSFESGKKIKHGRILLKAEDAFYELLDKFLPGRVRVEQEKIVFTALLREEAANFGSLPPEYLEALKAERYENIQSESDTLVLQAEEKQTDEKEIR